MTGPATPPRTRTSRSGAPTWVFVSAGALLTALLLGHRLVPDIGGVGLVLDTAAPWLGVLIPVLALTAVLCRCPAGAVTTLIPLLVWAYIFGSWWAPHPVARIGAASDDLTLVSQNLSADNTSGRAAAHALVGTDADIVAVQEFAGTNRAPVQQILDAAYPYREEVGTVALWSRYPTSDTTAADVGAGWRRGLRTHIATPHGVLVVYVVHLPSVRPADTATRNNGLTQLSRTLTADKAEQVVVAGDFNTADTDRHWQSFAPGYTDPQRSSGFGPGFTWPAAFPVARLDHILVRGLPAVTAGVLRVPGTDHRGVTATLRPPSAGV